MKIPLDQAKLTYTPAPLNTFLLVMGLAVVWLSSHNWIAMLGAFIASIHIAIALPRRAPS